MAYSCELKIEKYQPRAGDVVIWDFIPEHYQSERPARIEHCGVLDGESMLLYGGSTRTHGYEQTKLKFLIDVYGPPTVIYRHAPQSR